MKKLVRVREVHALEGYKCRLFFEDGTQKVVNLEPYLFGPIFEPILRDKKMFRSVRVIEGTIGWENGEVPGIFNPCKEGECLFRFNGRSYLAG